MKRSILILLSFLLTLGGFAQKSMSSVKVFLPRVLTDNVLKERALEAEICAEKNWGQNSTEKRRWSVYSDRENNTLYSEPSSTSDSIDKLNFNQKVYIAEIKNNFAHVYHEPREEIKGTEISGQAKFLGWVPMKKLLLWNSCPANDKGIYHKALIVVNLDNVKKDELNNLYNRYFSPDDKSNFVRASSSQDFFYVMKKESNLVLLEIYNKMYGHSYQTLYGWMASDSYVPWEQRSCVEPNWDPDIVETYKATHKTAEVFMDKEMTREKHIGTYEYGKQPLKGFDKYEKYRLPPEAVRYPILELPDNERGKGYYKCSAFGQNGSLGIAQIEQAKKTKMQNERLSEIKAINLIIVIDGTRSMDPFYDPVQKAIKKAYEYLVQKDITFKVGVVIYRDHDDVLNGKSYMIETFPLANPRNNNKLDEFLKNGGVYTIKSSPKDRSAAEALYQGLMTATDASIMGFKKKESNLLVVVGDCGNDDVKDKKNGKIITQDEVIKRLIENEFQIVSYQVRKSNSDAYNQFMLQMSDIIKKNMQGQYDNMITDKDKKVVVRMKTMQEKDGSGFELDFGMKKSYSIGTLLQPRQLDQNMKTEYLTNCINKSVEKFAEVMQNKVDLIVNYEINTKDELSMKVDSAIIEKIMGKEYMDLMKRTNSILSATGYTKIDDGKGHNYWNTIIYISEDELSQLLNKLGDVYEVACKTRNDDRGPYIRAMKAVIQSMIPEITNEEMMKKSQEEIMALIMGLNASTVSLRGYSLAQIQDKTVVSPQKYNSLLNTIKGKIEGLDRIKRDYRFKMKVNNLTFYWIPTENLP